jgi:Archaeal Glu-tRNAGln amidotransferase subunit E (contains GAD domain)
LEKIVDQIMSRNKSLIERNGQKAFGPIMGMVMKEVRGRANAEVVGEIINRKLAEAGKIG